jgi:hypothetical protein
MNSSDFWYAVGDFFTESFAILRMGGNAVNWFFIVAISVALIVWMVMQSRYNAEEMKENGKLK